MYVRSLFLSQRVSPSHVSAILLEREAISQYNEMIKPVHSLLELRMHLFLLIYTEDGLLFSIDGVSQKNAKYNFVNPIGHFTNSMVGASR